MAFLFLLVMLTVCAAYKSPQDMSDKMFTFPQETNTAYVRLTTARQSFKAVTVCMRTFSDLARDYVPFSLATPKIHNDFMIYRGEAKNGIYVHVRNNPTLFSGLDFQPYTWHSLCSTWDSRSGLVQLWLDGKPSSRRYNTESSISGPIIIILGQDQDSHGGAFDINQSFVGMMSDVHMWDYVISPCEIRCYTEELSFTPGNVLNWEALSFQTQGRLLIEDKQRSCL